MITIDFRDRETLLRIAFQKNQFSQKTLYFFKMKVHIFLLAIEYVKCKLSWNIWISRYTKYQIEQSNLEDNEELQTKYWYYKT